MLFLYILVMQQ